MLKASELRLGNYGLYRLDNECYPFEVTMIAPSHIEFDLLGDAPLDFSRHQTDVLYEYIEPITLTEDWLLKAGFTKIDHDIMNDIPKFLDGRCQYVVSITKSHSVVCAYDESDGSQWYLAAIFYLHELQNLYYSLTNEELTINL